MSRSLIVLSGCSGGGKSTLLEEMQRRGYPIVEEAGRRVVAEALAGNSDALPWKSAVSFVRACVRLHLQDLEGLGDVTGPVFLDRCLVDVISYLELKSLPVPDDLEILINEPRYSKTIFIVPPWPEIFKTDKERKTTFADAVKEYDHLCLSFKRLGYKLTEIPKYPIGKRADYLENLMITPTNPTNSLGTG